MVQIAIVGFGAKELDTVDALGVVSQSVLELALDNVPQTDSGVLSRTCDKFITVTYTDLCDVVMVALQRCLQHKRLSIPNFECPIKKVSWIQR